MITIFIQEEYGYRDWVAEMTEDEYELLLDSWNSMRGLNCLVPVTLIIPQAKPFIIEEGWRDKLPEKFKRCHIHECDDSYLEGTEYRPPEDECFIMDGIRYEQYGLNWYSKRTE